MFSQWLASDARHKFASAGDFFDALQKYNKTDETLVSRKRYSRRALLVLAVPPPSLLPLPSAS